VKGRYYEWAKVEKGPKQPYFFHLEQNQIMTFAGLYQTKKYQEKEESFYVILTVLPSKETAWIHNRMPAILTPNQIDTWLNPETSVEEALSLLKPYENNDTPLHWYPVSNNINNPKYNAPECLQEIEEAPITIKESGVLEEEDNKDDEYESYYEDMDFTNAKKLAEEISKPLIKDEEQFWCEAADLLKDQLEGTPPKRVPLLEDERPNKKLKVEE